jgi:hypothetical protein
MIPRIEALEIRLAPALAIYGLKSTPTPTMAKFTIATTSSSQEAVKIDYGSARVAGSSDPGGDGI